MKKILVGLTTTSGSDWREKIEDTKRLNITELALFPTCLNAQERQEMYALLEKSPVVSIPHVHLRSDMATEEMQYLIEKYKTQYFNIHPSQSKYASSQDYSPYEKQIYVENSSIMPSKEELNKYAGLCVDFSHWEGEKDSTFKNFYSLADEYPIGCCHISAVRFSWWRLKNKDDHTYRRLSELDYVKKYISYLPEFISLELENDFKEQLEAKKYLQKIIRMSL